ncbi:MAG TPA: hypothetical protein VEA80_04455 [Vitreimonas sp.]|uniref:hypothetical protein n=1 Tax=Vitreimonas sp. TaxID=3069702 RepID=UPI002D3F18ED|nr:hypothetical protein [Vitreimonas sp.]HYD86704.1 hypothetical protein [Vitreimonas sp.]
MDEDPVTIRVLFEEPDGDLDALETCPHCGQGFDSRELAAVLHHRQPEHGPLEAQ